MTLRYLKLMNDGKKVIIDKFLKGEISDKQAILLLGNFQPKQLKPVTELSGYAQDRYPTLGQVSIHFWGG